MKRIWVSKDGGHKSKVPVLAIEKHSKNLLSDFSKTRLEQADILMKFPEFKQSGELLPLNYWQ